MIEVWNWVLSWVLGWGGLAAVACAIAWAAWWFVPVFKPQLLHVAVGVTIFAVASTWFFTKGYESGYDSAIAAIARDDQAAVDRVSAGRTERANCRARGGTWDVTTGTCR